jgi:ketosteroid isomerase-like protein
MSDMHAIFAALLAIMLSACALAPVDHAAANAALLAADQAFAAKSAASTPGEAFYAFVAEDGIQLPPVGDPVIGREAIRKAVSEGSPTALRWQPRFAEVSKSEDLGWTWGDWQALEPGANGRRLAYGRYVNVWKKQPDGSWKVRLDMGNVARKPGAP